MSRRKGQLEWWPKNCVPGGAQGPIVAGETGGRGDRRSQGHRLLMEGMDFGVQQVSLGVPSMWGHVPLPSGMCCVGGRHVASHPEMSRKVTAAEAEWMWGFRHLAPASSRTNCSPSGHRPAGRLVLSAVSPRGRPPCHAGAWRSWFCRQM